MNAVLPNAAYARFLRLTSAIFLFVGLFAVAERVWTLCSDLHARRTWPIADGKILSVKQRDDSELSNKSGSVGGHTLYWVEYEVGFALPPERCRTGVIYEGPSEMLPCHGFVQTRSTQSTSEVFDWYLHGYQPNQPVKVLWNPEGMTDRQIKIDGESLGLRYNVGRLVFSVIWVLGFGALYAFCRKQLAYFAGDQQEERVRQR